MIFGGRIGNNKTHRDAIEKLTLAKIIANKKNELVASRPQFFSGEQRNRCDRQRLFGPI